MTPFPPIERSAMPAGPEETVARRISRWILAVVYLAAGTLHLLMPATFQQITPDWVPFPRWVVLATGLCELLGAIGLMTRRLRAAAGIGLALYAVCVFPANIKHAFDDLSGGQAGLGWWYHLPRLAFQPVMVWWALAAGGLVQGPRPGALRGRAGHPGAGTRDGLP